MKQITLKDSIGGVGQAGSTQDVDDAVADLLVRKGRADYVEAEKPAKEKPATKADADKQVADTSAALTDDGVTL